MKPVISGNWTAKWINVVESLKLQLNPLESAYY